MREDMMDFTYLNEKAREAELDIWFSSCIGKDADDGNNRYARLITFKAASEAEPIAAKAKKSHRRGDAMEHRKRAPALTVSTVQLKSIKASL
jgi:hypothetical protein